ncbi:MAG: SPOR domain-containing protein [Flavobacteriaceae bacterium]|nr:SPOR domain-containing protein [Flavobacteriaceae bacterium]
MNRKYILPIFLVIFCLGIFTGHGQTIKDEKVTSLINKKRAYNKKNGYGFRIQLDNGFETRVKTTRSKFRIEFPTIQSYLLFESPEWKVQVGDYKTKLEADKMLNSIKAKFPSAIIVPR